MLLVNSFTFVGKLIGLNIFQEFLVGVLKYKNCIICLNTYVYILE